MNPFHEDNTPSSFNAPREQTEVFFRGRDRIRAFILRGLYFGCLSQYLLSSFQISQAGGGQKSPTRPTGGAMAWVWGRLVLGMWGIRKGLLVSR